MGSVYSKAACAFIWLGPGDEDSDRALSFVDSLWERVLGYIAGYDGDDLLDDMLDLPDGAISPSDDQGWVKLYALLSRPWFHRSWTFQEPILAPKRMIACGSEIRDWITFVLAASRYLHLKGRDGTTILPVFPLMTIHYCIAEKPEDRRLSRLLYENTPREASDPRDKVYALYGLVQAYQKVPLKINYAISVEDVYRSTVRYCIESEESLSILTYVSSLGNQSDFPSWVPDWRCCFEPGCTAVDPLYCRVFNASSRSRPLLVPSSSNEKLILKGFILAIVERTIDIAALKCNAIDSFRQSWLTNAATAGVPMHFLQGKTFHTSYDLTMTMEQSPCHTRNARGVAPVLWKNSTSWFAAGCPSPIPQAVSTEYKRYIDMQTNRRLLFLTKDSLGLAPKPTQVGDRVCILPGSDVPFILRPRQKMARTTPNEEAKPKRQETSKTTPQGIRKSAHQGPRKSARVAKQAIEAAEWTLIGDCYLHGYMDGEAMRTVTEEDYVNFTLV